MLKKVLSFSFLSILFIPILVLAHQPRLAESNFIEVQNPEISQAFYGKLEGEPVYYKIESSEPFNLYVGILVPDVPNIDKDVSAEIYIEKDGQKELLALLDGLNHNWPAYYEEFAGDDYFWGPEFEAENAGEFIPKGKRVEAGIYLVKVFSPDNQGKYVFVVGEKEEFPASEIINTIKVLPKLKSDFFGKSAWSAFFNRIGFYLIIPLAIVIILALVILIIIKKIKRKKIFN
jgi:hypothetical protein